MPPTIRGITWQKCGCGGISQRFRSNENFLPVAAGNAPPGSDEPRPQTSPGRFTFFDRIRVVSLYLSPFIMKKKGKAVKIELRYDEALEAFMRTPPPKKKPQKKFWQVNNLPPTERGHLVALDSLRGIAALGVAIGHVGWTTVLSGTPFFDNSAMLVDFFFVLSGFVITLNYADRLRTNHDLRHFMWLRFWRLFPLHIALLIPFAIWAARRGGFSPAAFLENLTLTQVFWGGHELAFNAPAWSISAEFYTYLLFGAACVAARGRIVTLSLLVAVGIFMTHAFSLPFILGHWYIMRCVAEFGLGVVTFRAWQRFADRIRRPSWLVVLSLVAMGALLISPPGRPWSYWEPLISMAVVFSVATTRNGVVAQVLTCRPLVLVGAWSYSIYMTHAGVLLVMRGALRHWQPAATINPVAGTVWATFALAVMLAVSTFTFRLVEEPLRLWSRRNSGGAGISAAKPAVPSG